MKQLRKKLLAARLVAIPLAVGAQFPAMNERPPIKRRAAHQFATEVGHTLERYTYQTLWMPNINIFRDARLEHGYGMCSDASELIHEIIRVRWP